MPALRLPFVSARLLRVTCAFLMLSFLPSLFAAGSKPDYPRLSENTAGSPRQELRKLLHGQVDGMFVAPASHQMIAAAGGYLWRFSAQGELLETLYEPEHMFASGIAFGPSTFIDWVHTGDRQHKAYGPTVDGNALSQAELFAALDRASVVEFARRDKTVWAFLWADGKAWKMDITHHGDKVDTICGRETYSYRELNWDRTCFEGYKARPRPLRELEPESFARDTEVSRRVEVDDFNRRVYHLEGGISEQLLDATLGTLLRGMGYPGGGPERLWFGDARARLKVGGEEIRFTAFVPRRRGDYGFYTNMKWWEPAALVPGMSPWFTVHMRGYMELPGEEGLLRHYVKDIGLFAVRPRGTGALPAERREVATWRPVFEGPSTRGIAVSGKVEMASGGAAHRWLRSPEPRKRIEGMPPTVVVEALWPDLQQLPRALTVEWESPWNEDSHAVLRIELEAAETQRAFQQLRDAKGTLELVLQVPDLEANPDRMGVSLRAGSTTIALPGARLAYVQRPATTKAEQRAARIAANKAASSWQQPFQAARQAAREEPARALTDFLQLCAELAQDPQRAEASAPAVTAAYAELLVHYNVSRDFASSSTLMRHYLAAVHPHIGNLVRDPGQPYNVTVLASQTLAFGLHSPTDRDLVDTVMQTLIGPQFDPRIQTNATLMYNLACYYAVAGDKPRLLQSVEAARRLGKPASQFMEDADFSSYWQDEAFRKALQGLAS
ncbi:hypothetical protein [Niveibacterium sp. SC-1]|uniref:TPR end-of-group domain-containing protein n=1 Tax=Niveibacterium sp. SC-1 TaxID=3135646 RepID=UPI0031200C23